MRVCLTAADLCSGAMGNSTTRLAVALRRHSDVDVSVVCLTGATAARNVATLTAEQVPVRVIGARTATAFLAALPSVYAELAPDVVVPVPEFVTIAAVLARGRLGRRGRSIEVLPYVRHPPSLGHTETWRGHQLLLRAELRHGHRYLAVSPGSAADARSFLRLGTTTPIHVVPPTFEPDAVHDRTLEDDGELRLVTVSRLVQLKRHDLMLHALRRVRSAGIEARLTIVGKGPAQPAIEHLVSQLDLDDVVTLAGPERDLTTHLANADAYVSASDEEGFGNAILESMAAGVPVIATDAVGGGPRFIAGGSSAIRLTRLGDVDDLARAIGEFAGVERRRLHRSTGLCRAATFAYPATAARFVAAVSR